MSDNVYKALKEQSSTIRVDGELVEKTDEAWTVRLGPRVLQIKRKDATEIEYVDPKSNAISLMIAADAEIVESVLIEAGSVHARRSVDWGPKPPGPLVDWGPKDCSVCVECTECSVCAQSRTGQPIGLFRRIRVLRNDD